MKKMRKVQFAASVLGVAAAVTGLALVGNPVQANADEEAKFAMENGAAVRAVANSAGIRWTTNVTEAWYTANIPEDATDVKFGTFVTAAGNVSAITELTAETDEVQDLACKAAVDFTNGAFTYYSSIVYNNMDDWSADEKLSAYATELIARSYVKYTLNEETTYVYADSNENQRSMRAVALAAYEDTSDKALTDTQKGYIDDYFASEQTAVDFAGYYETKAKEAVANYTAAYIGAKKVGTVSEGALTLDGLTLGENYTLTLFDADGNYAKTSEFKYVTQVLDDKTEFEAAFNVSGTISGYYVLAEDIDLGNTYYGAGTFKGTLDGQGHTIRGIKMPNSTHTGGLVKYLSGTIKNVRIEGKMEGTKGYGLIALSVPTGATALVENVYFEYTNVTTTSSAHSSPIARYNYGNLTMRNVVAYCTSSGKTYGGVLMGALMSGTSTTAASETTFENCYSITANELNFISTAQTTEPLPIQNGSIQDGSIKEYKGENAYANFYTAEKENLSNELKAMLPAVELDEKGNILLTQDNFKTYFDTAGDITGNYVLAEDIDLGNTYYGTGTFKGTLDGQGHTISGIKMPNSTHTGGLFKNLSGTIKNVRIEGKMEGTKGYGLIASTVPSGATALIENVYFEYTNVTTISTAHSSPVVRYNYGNLTMRNVVAYCTSSDATYGGVLMGALMSGTSTTAASETTFENCYSITANALNAISTAQTTEPLPIQNGSIQDGSIKEYKGETAKADFDADVAAGEITLTDMLKALMYPTNN